MKNCLVFLTKTFPYGTGEEFIANELPVVAKEFEKVILIATSVPDNPVQTRTVPDNTEIHAIRSSFVQSAVKPAAAKFFFACPKKYRCMQEKRAMGHSPVRRLYRTYFIAKGEAVAREAEAVLADAGLERYDAVTFYSYWLYDTALAALLLKEGCRAPKSAAYSRAHGYDLYPRRNPSNYLPLRPYLLQNLDGIFPCSENGSAFLKQAWPEFAGRVETSYLGTSDHGLGPADGSPEFCIVSCCHIVPVKRVDLLARALAVLDGSGLKLKWVHFGGGDGLDKLEWYASEHLGFMEYRFAGEVTNDALMDFYRTNRADLFVNTSSSEGLPVSIMEACSFGVPVAATNVGGTGEIVRNGRNGFLLDAALSPEALAEVISRAARMTDEERNALRAASREIWEQDFNAQTNYARFARKIDPLCEP